VLINNSLATYGPYQPFVEVGNRWFVDSREGRLIFIERGHGLDYIFSLI
jgi:hypothetical protein